MTENGPQKTPDENTGNSVNNSVEKSKKDLSYLKEFQFKPGQSGNLRGRPKEVIRSEFRQFLDEPSDVPDKTKRRQFIEKVFDTFIKTGDPKLAEFIINNCDGILSKNVQVTGEDGGPIQTMDFSHLTAQELILLIKELRSDDRGPGINIIDAESNGAGSRKGSGSEETA